MGNKITLVITSCGRFNFLNSTVISFFKFNTHPIEKVIIIDNSNSEDGELIIENIINKFSNNYEIIINKSNIGQVASIDIAYSLVTTDYIYHCEDDWEFFDYGFVEKSLDVLNHDDRIINVNTRVRFDGERGSMHPVSEDFTTKLGTKYNLYIPKYLDVWHGFSWNPGLRRKKDYDIIKPYSNFKNEQGVGNEYYKLGYRSACLEKCYNKHSGTNSFTEKSNM